LYTVAAPSGIRDRFKLVYLNCSTKLNQRGCCRPPPLPLPLPLPLLAERSAVSSTHFRWKKKKNPIRVQFFKLTPSQLTLLSWIPHCR
jgi:hypothetical protein